MNAVTRRLAQQLVDARKVVAAARATEKAILEKLSKKLVADKFLNEDKEGRPGYLMTMILEDGSVVRGTQTQRDSWDNEKARGMLTRAQLLRCRKPETTVVRFYTPSVKDSSEE
jgi:hypothetical protein